MFHPIEFTDLGRIDIFNSDIVPLINRIVKYTKYILLSFLHEQFTFIRFSYSDLVGFLILLTLK